MDGAGLPSSLFADRGRTKHWLAVRAQACPQRMQESGAPLGLCQSVQPPRPPGSHNPSLAGHHGCKLHLRVHAQQLRRGAWWRSASHAPSLLELDQ